MSAVKVPQHLRDLAKRARARGWEISYAGNGHLRWSLPGGGFVMTGSSPHARGCGPRIERGKLAKAGLA